MFNQNYNNWNQTRPTYPINNNQTMFNQPQSFLSNQNNAYYQQHNQGYQKMSLSGGRIVSSESDIIPNEIPMDGSLGVFVTENLQEIYLKTWGGNGEILRNKYVLVTDDQPEMVDKNEAFISEILTRLDRIEQSLSLKTSSNQNEKNIDKRNDGNRHPTQKKYIQNKEPEKIVNNGGTENEQSN